MLQSFGPHAVVMSSFNVGMRNETFRSHFDHIFKHAYCKMKPLIDVKLMFVNTDTSDVYLLI